MNIINPFASLVSGLQFYFIPQPEIIISNTLLIKEINQSSEILFGIRKNEALGKNFLEICNDKNIIASIQEHVDFILSGNIYKLKDKLLIEKDKHKSVFEMVCYPISSHLEPKAIDDMIVIVLNQIGYSELNEPKKEAVEFNYHNCLPLKLSIENGFQKMPCSILWMDRHHVYRGCNIEACRCFGAKSSQEIIGKDIFDWAKINNWSQLKVQKIYDTDERIMKTGVAEFNIEKVLPQDDNLQSIIQVEIKKPIFNHYGEVIALIVVGLADDF